MANNKNNIQLVMVGVVHKDGAVYPSINVQGSLVTLSPTVAKIVIDQLMNVMYGLGYGHMFEDELPGEDIRGDLH